MYMKQTSKEYFSWVVVKYNQSLTLTKTTNLMSINISGIIIIMVHEYVQCSSMNDNNYGTSSLSQVHPTVKTLETTIATGGNGPPTPKNAEAEKLTTESIKEEKQGKGKNAKKTKVRCCLLNIHMYHKILLHVYKEIFHLLALCTCTLTFIVVYTYPRIQAFTHHMQN